MIHGKWYKGIDDLSPIGRDFTQKDIGRWHLHLCEDDNTKGYCAIELLSDGWQIIKLEYYSKVYLDLILRLIKRKLESFGATAVIALSNEDLKVFGFADFNDKFMKADPIYLPKLCKE